MGRSTDKNEKQRPLVTHRTAAGFALVSTVGLLEEEDGCLHTDGCLRLPLLPEWSYSFARVLEQNTTD